MKKKLRLTTGKIGLFTLVILGSIAIIGVPIYEIDNPLSAYVLFGGGLLIFFPLVYYWVKVRKS